LINTDKIIERIATQVEESGSREAKELHASAIELQSKARILFDDENYKEALSTSRAAADAANQALRIIERE